MGGFGSGRHGGRMKIEECRPIDVRRLQREGCLDAGWSGLWQWKRDGASIASIRMRSDGCRLHLAYRLRTGTDDWEAVEESIEIERTSCRFGGTRPYFICPGVVAGRACRRRVILLYGPGRYFLCRHCYRLAYASQHETDIDRVMRRADKLKVRLGGEAGRMGLWPTRLKGMWRRTWERHMARLERLEEHADAMFYARAAELVARCDARERRATRGRRSFWK